MPLIPTLEPCFEKPKEERKKANCSFSCLQRTIQKWKLKPKLLYGFITKNKIGINVQMKRFSVVLVNFH